MAYGLTAEGFVTKTYENVVDEIDARLRTALGASVRLDAKSLLGNIRAIFAERIAELWELGEHIYSSQDPGMATGDALRAIGLLTGTIIEAAARSTVDLVLAGTVGTDVPAASVISADSTDVRFRTTNASGAFGALAAWAGTTAYTVGQRRSNSGRSYRCITAGTSAGAGGPTTTAAVITDGTVEWTYLGEGTAVADVVGESVDTGPVVGAARDLINIENPVAGWSSVINLAAAVPGSNVETDEDYRVRREAELAAAGNSPPDAIRSEVLAVDGVTTCRVFYNPTDTTDADGIPPHSVEVLVQGGTNQDIGDVLLDAVAAGIGTHGTTSVVAVDSVGHNHTMKFSRPAAIPIWIIVEVIVDPDEFPADGAAQIKDIIVLRGTDDGVGRDAVSSRIKSWVFGVDGVLDVTRVEIGLSDPPSVETTIVITSRQLATYAVARITVATTNGEP